MSKGQRWQLWFETTQKVQFIVLSACGLFGVGHWGLNSTNANAHAPWHGWKVPFKRKGPCGACHAHVHNCSQTLAVSRSIEGYMF